VRAGDEVITFINRNLEPYRGYHIFMRALPEVLLRRPKAVVLIVGGDGVSYGASAPAGQTWKQIFFDEVRDCLNLNRANHVPQIRTTIHQLPVTDHQRRVSGCDRWGPHRSSQSAHTLTVTLDWIERRIG